MFSTKDLYNLLPPAMQSLAASIHGYRLCRKRYTNETDKLVAEALERERWSESEWQQWRDGRLSYILQRAATKVPYYRQYWQNRRRSGDKLSWNYLENWPILTKDEVRENAQAFVAEDIALSSMSKWNTSGTTGKPITFYKTLETERQWYALAEARWRRWYGVSRFDRWAIIGGQVVVPIKRKQPPFWVWNAGLRQLYMSSYHLSAAAIPLYIEAMNKYEVKYIYGYPSALNAIAQTIKQHNYKMPKLAVAVTNAEPLYDYQRATIESAFNCPVRETYGMTEMVTAASECEAGKMHLWPEAGILEILDADMVINPNLEEGELVATSLINADMCLIRYRHGDYGSFADKLQQCSCGRKLPLISKIEGRTDDVLLTADGRQISRLGSVFWGLNIKEAQIIQEKLDLIRVLIVPATGFSRSTREDIAQRIKDRMGPLQVEIEEVNEIPRGSNGKFRAVICKLNQ